MEKRLKNKPPKFALSIYLTTFQAKETITKLEHVWRTGGLLGPASTGTQGLSHSIQLLEVLAY